MKRGPSASAKHRNQTGYYIYTVKELAVSVKELTVLVLRDGVPVAEGVGTVRGIDRNAKVLAAGAIVAVHF